jgi:hypothetical protein
MMKKTLHIKFSLFIILILATISSDIIAQNKTSDCVINIDSTVFDENITGEYFVNDGHVGRIFYNTDWRKGEILLENNRIVPNKILNLYLFNEQLIWMRNLDYKQISVSQETVKEFRIYSTNGIPKQVFRKIKFKTRMMDINYSEIFLQVLAEGKITLYAYRKVWLNKNTNELIPTFKYYIQVNNSEIESYSPNRWSLYSVAKKCGLKQEMKDIVQNNHLHIRDELGIIKALEIFNTKYK